MAGGGETKVKFSELTINVMRRVLSQSKFGSILLERLISYLISKQARLNAFYSVHVMDKRHKHPHINTHQT